ncbi:Zn-dependent hydrolase, including glyoxylase [Rubellimicrobium thermophilum DSM 16684]|uniref:Zn-dependent hydrolase, including glyoxylase n=1 Tax=Rubellimicrobium thermophilum DSM 16684 TaxID=1123069 RepID=S9QUJ6_9RHOB|nr:MBL fold metallo-hydrolase [Rubellimicrobium thermophilum]EPX83308.1 Zn-dependent hydrolase, including glyoxylase [Rubellimicrobium thermophilum DSM 16684]
MLSFPFPEPPPPGEWHEVAPGLLWARLPLPFRLDHVNIYAIADGDGWVLFDTGIADDTTRALWDRLLPALGPVQALIVSHNDPDHIGLAGWLCDRLDVPLWTSRASFLSATALVRAPALMEAADHTRFYTRHGLGPEVVALLAARGHRYRRLLSDPPPRYRRLAAGMVLRLGGRDWTVLTGEGHAPEQVMLHAPADRLLLAADQILEQISPNVSVSALEPEGDPLGDYLACLRGWRRGRMAAPSCWRGTGAPSSGWPNGPPRCTPIMRRAAISSSGPVQRRRAAQPICFPCCFRRRSMPIRRLLPSARRWPMSTASWRKGA